MDYTKLWDKNLNPGEKVRYEFSISRRYRKILLIFWVVFFLLFIDLPTLFAGVGVAILITACTLLPVWFYFNFYLPRANAYAFTDKRVLIHKGWLSTKATTIDYNKIVEITVSEPFLARVIFRSGYLTVKTAGVGAHDRTLRAISQPYEVKKKLDELAHLFQ